MTSGKCFSVTAGNPLSSAGAEYDLRTTSLQPRKIGGVEKIPGKILTALMITGNLLGSSDAINPSQNYSFCVILIQGNLGNGTM